MNNPVSLIMTKDVVTVNPKDRLIKAKDLIFEKHFHHIPVVENGQLVGIVTSYDLMKLDKRFADYEDIIIEDVMTKRVVTIGPKTKIGTAAQIFLRHLFHGLPIVDDDQHLKGIVTSHDVMRYEYDKAYPNDELEKAYRNDPNKSGL